MQPVGNWATGIFTHPEAYGGQLQRSRTIVPPGPAEPELPLHPLGPVSPGQLAVTVPPGQLFALT